MAGASKKEDVKKRKVEAADEKDARDVQGFSVVRVLSENASKKCLFLEGEIADDGGEAGSKAVLLLEKKSFESQSVGSWLPLCRVQKTLDNDIYRTFELQPPPSFTDIKATLIFPATAKHIAKYTAHEIYLIQETPRMYREITLPYVKKQSLAIQWVYNILEKKAEVEHVVYEDPDPDVGFVLLPDMKWDGKDMNSLYLVAIARKRGSLCLRDVNETHLPLLKNIQKKCSTEILERFGVPPGKLRMYLHYLPSYFHLHVHITHAKYDAPGICTERAHLLLDVIDNVELKNTYYQDKTLTFSVQENHPVFQSFKGAGYIV